MLDDLKIRNKLILLVAIPIIVLIVLAGLGVQERRNTAANAGRVEDLVTVARANSAMADALQTEALHSSAFVASGRGDTHSEALAEARAATDVASAAALDQFSANRDTSANFRSSVTLAEDAVAKLEYIREAVDQGYEWDQVVETYSALEDTFLAVNDTVSAALADPEVAAQLRTGAALASFKAAIASQGALLAGAQETGGLRVTEPLPADAPEGAEPTVVQDHTDLMTAAQSREASQDAILASIADTGRKGQVRDALTSDARVGFDEARANALQGLPIGGEGGSADIPALSSQIQADLHEVETSLFATLIDQARGIRSDAERAATIFLVIALAAVALAIAGAVILGRRITRPLDHLTEAADDLSTVQMPRLVEWLRNPSEDDMAFELGALSPIEVQSNDEIGKLASSFNEVQRVAGEVAAEQASLLRKGIGEMFVNLARRNQALLDRQIDFIDDLERTEEDPDQLENLYKLDHLATRMRRNAESLLVLAGAEPPRRRGRPAPLANVVRAAVAEVEDFGRIDLLSFDEVLVASNVAADLAHLLSELMENATNFSPPETRVEVVGHRTKADGYVISVSDHGIGMSADQISEANQLLAKPPLVGLALSRSLGFIVVGRLSVRHGVTVRLMSSPNGGVTAVVTVPPSLVTDTPGAAGSEPAFPAGAPAMPSEPIDVPARADQAPPSHLTPVPEPPQPEPVGSDGPLLAPLAFTPNDTPAPSASPRATGPVRRTGGESNDQGLPSRRSPAAAPAPAPEPTAPAPAPAPEATPPAPVSEPTAPAASEPGLPPRRTHTPPETPAPEVPAAAATGTPPPMAFSDPAGEPATPAAELDGLHLDGPPPSAPSLPTRARPERSSAPVEESSTKPYFLEESGPPRLFGRQAEPAAPPAAPTPPAAPPAAPAPPVARPAAAAPSAPPAPPVAPTPSATPAPPVAPAPPAASSPPRMPTRPPAAPAPPIPPAPAMVPSAPDPAASAAPAAAPTTSAGLARRTPRKSSDRVIPGSGGQRAVGATTRSPEDVRNLLSGFRAGQARARAAGPADDRSTEPKESDE